MRKILALALVAVTLALTPVNAFAAMSEQAAVTRARTLWGSNAFVDQLREVNDKTGTKRVGVKTTHCNQDFTVMGSGAPSWEAAFSNYATRLGAMDVSILPVSGTVGFTYSVSVDSTVDALQWVVDGALYGSPVAITAPQSGATSFDTTGLANGFHSVCGIFSSTTTSASTGSTPTFMAVSN